MTRSSNVIIIKNNNYFTKTTYSLPNTLKYLLNVIATQMMLKNQSKVVLRQNLYMRSMQCLICMMPLHINYAHADSSKEFMQSVKSGISQIFVPKPDENYNKPNIHNLSNFQLDTS